MQLQGIGQPALGGATWGQLGGGIAPRLRGNGRDARAQRVRLQDLNARMAARIRDQRTQKKSKKPKKEKKSKPGSKLEYKRVDQLWDSSIHNYKLTDTAEDEESSEYDQYLFNVRRTFDWEGKYKVCV